KHGITNALRLRNADDAWIRKRMTVCGLRTVHELRGIACYEIEPTPKTKQQIACSRSFGSATADLQELRAAVAFFTSRVAEKLPEHQLLAGEMSVSVTTDVFKDTPQYAKSVRLSIAPKSDSTIELLRLSMKGLGSAYRPGFAIRRAGVWLDGLE